jgi:hypothetical protein
MDLDEPKYTGREVLEIIEAQNRIREITRYGLGVVTENRENWMLLNQIPGELRKYIEGISDFEKRLNP